MKFIKVITFLTFAFFSLILTAQNDTLTNYCYPPVSLLSSEITQTSVVLSWAKVNSTATYNVCYYTIDALTGVYNYKYQKTTDIRTVIQGLTPNTKYFWKVKSLCLIPGSTQYTETAFSVISDFTTLAAPPLSCGVPANLQATAITTSSATLKWDIVQTACLYNIVYYQSNVNPLPPVSTIQTKEPTIILSGLSANSVYEWKVQSVCCNSAGTQTTSDFSSGSTFTTSLSTGCNPPKELFSTNITQTSAQLNWNLVDGVAVYAVYYYINGSTTLNYAKVTTNSFLLQGLTAATKYVWKVKSFCQNPNANTYTESDFSVLSDFTTLPATPPPSCGVPTNPNTIDITYNSATVNWTAVDGACNYGVVYYPAGVVPEPPYNVITTQDIKMTLNNLLPNTKYTWKVLTNCCSGSGLLNQSDFTREQSFATLPSPTATCIPPKELKSSNITQSSAQLNWSLVDGAAYYTVYYYPANSTVIKYEKVTTNSFVLQGLVAETAYIWKVKSFCLDPTTNVYKESEFSVLSDFRTLSANPAVCAVPVNPVVRDLTSTSAILSWDAVAGACSYGVVCYDPNSPTMPPIVIINTNENKLAFNNLKPNTKYTWQVKTFCCDPNGVTYESEFTVSQSFTTLSSTINTCLPPKELLSSNITQSSAVLNWNKVDNAAYYVVYYYSENNALKYERTQSNIFTLQGLLAGTKYYWKVKTFCISNSSTTTSESDFSIISDFTTLTTTPNVCLPPAELASGNITQNSATLKWSPTLNTCNYILYYYPAGHATDLMKYITLKENFITLTALIPNTRYEWKVKSVCCDAAGSATESEYSVSSSFLTLAATNPICNPPKNLMSLDITQTSTTLTWDAVDGAAGYMIVYWSSGNVNNPMYLKSTTNKTVLTGLTPATRYEWKVQSYCSSSNVNQFSEVAGFTTLSSVITDCIAPRELNSTGITTNSVIIYWNPVAAAVGYVVAYWQVGNFNNPILVKSSLSKLSLTGLNPATKYEWKVKSICATTAGTENTSDFSLTSNFTTLTLPTNNCLAPIDLFTRNVTENSAVLAWTPVSNAYSYLVYIYTNNTSQYKSIQTNVPKIIVDGLYPNTKYQWKVKTYCYGTDSTNSSSSSSDFSKPMDFATLGVAPAVCNAPELLKTTDITFNSAILNWSIAKNAKYYILYYWTGTETPKYIISSTNTYNVTGLNPATKYVWKVKSVCDITTDQNISYSDFSKEMGFVTLSPPERNCKVPMELKSTDISAYTANLSWNIIDNATYYLVILKSTETNTAAYKYFITKEPKLIANRLRPSTAYEWRVKALCAKSSINAYVYSDFSISATFKTLADSTINTCPVPTRLAAYDITVNSAMVSWQPVKPNKLYVVVYQTPRATDEVKVKTTSEPGCKLENLMPNTVYTWKVANLCDLTNNSTLSRFSEVSTFITPVVKKSNLIAAKNFMDENTSMSIYPNPTDGIVNINLNNLMDKTTLSVFNIQGQMVYSDEIQQNTTSTSINLTEYPKGMYFIKLVNQNFNKTEKVIIK